MSDCRANPAGVCLSVAVAVFMCACGCGRRQMAEEDCPQSVREETARQAPGEHVVAVSGGDLPEPRTQEKTSSQDNYPVARPTIPAKAKPGPAPATASPDRGRYTSDLDRLSRLAERINRACRASHVVTLGSGSAAVRGGPITVDYAVFDRLSDDGAAVLIAEAMVIRSTSRASITASPNPERALREVDEAVGRYLALAGFAPDGFAEWLRITSNPAFSTQSAALPQRVRVAAFMRGFRSVRIPGKEN